MPNAFEIDCALIKAHFQTQLDPGKRRCVSQIDSWESVYLVKFFWGSPKFFSKEDDLLGNTRIVTESGLVKKYIDPLDRKNNIANLRGRKAALPKSASVQRWNKEKHLYWVEINELHARYYWGCRKYFQSESEESEKTLAAFTVLGLEPNATVRDVKKSFRELAMRFHPDRGGNQENFEFLKENYEKVIRYLHATETTQAEVLQQR